MTKEICRYCQSKGTDQCDDCPVEFEREYKTDDKDTYYIHRNFTEAVSRGGSAENTTNLNDTTVHTTHVIDTLKEYAGETLTIGVIANIVANIDIKEREGTE